MSYELILPFFPEELQRLLLDDTISDLMINGTSGVYADRDGIVQPIPLSKPYTNETLQAAIQRIARLLGQDLTEQNPILNTRLPDGSRVAVVGAPSSINGPTLTIRKFNRWFTTDELIGFGSLPEVVRDKVVEFIATKKNGLISGATSSGKSTVLKAFLDHIPSDERLIVIEEPAELKIKHENAVQWEAVKAIPGQVAITPSDLLAAALRHRLDRIVMGVLFNQTVGTPQRLWLANARTGWQLGTKDTLTVSFAANTNDTENKGVGGLVLQEAGAFARVSEYDLRAVNTTFLAKSLLHSVRVGLSWKTTEQAPNTTAPQVAVAGAFTGGGSTIGRLHNAERDLEFDDEVYLSKKAHTIKAGVQLLGAFIDDNDPDTFNGAFSFGGGFAPALDGSGSNTTITGPEQYRRALAGLPGGRPTTYSQTSGTATVPLEQWTIAAYAQDDWKVNSRLSLSGGLRYFAQTAPIVLKGVAPRMGLTYAFGKKQTWVFHTRTGLFYAPIASPASLETVRLDGQRQRSLTVYSPVYNNPPRVTCQHTAD